MRITHIRLQNFRAFDDAVFSVNPYTCLVGDNGCGKSNVLAALCVFFGDTASTPYAGVLEKEDYHDFDTSTPIRITVTFEGMGPEALGALKAYVRNKKVVVTAEGFFDAASGHGKVLHYGVRQGIVEFKPYFEADKLGQGSTELKEIYKLLRSKFSDLPDVWKKAEMQSALRAYEEAHPDKCEEIRSADNFYGINSLGILRPHIQWLFVPAVKDAADEAQEARRTVLAQLIARLVRVKTTFGSDIEKLRARAERVYQRLLAKNSPALAVVSGSLRARVKSWANAGLSVDLQWLFDEGRSVQVREPTAGVIAGDDRFSGAVWRMGHGLQRLYLLALLQELAESGSDGMPTLVLGFEEPELYQHPPQARHMVDVLEGLVSKRYQAIATTHSPYFVTGDGFENVRIVRRKPGKGTAVSEARYEEVIAKIRALRNEDAGKPLGRSMSRLHQVLAPEAAEMFFCRSVVLVEGMSDIAYITTHMRVTGRWAEFRRLGGHIVCANGKSWLLELAVIARTFSVPFYIIWDADGSCQGKAGQGAHEKDNQSFRGLLDNAGGAFPETDEIEEGHAVWPDNLEASIVAEMPGMGMHRDRLRNLYGNAGGVDKFTMFIAQWMSDAADAGLRSGVLEKLCERIMAHAAAAGVSIGADGAAAARGGTDGSSERVAAGEPGPAQDK